MTYDFSVWPDAVLRLARAKRRYLAKRYPQRAIICTDGYLWELCEEQADCMTASAILDGKRMTLAV